MKTRSKRILAIDCETNDKPKDWQNKNYDVENWPRLVQLGVVLGDTDGRILYRHETLIRSARQWTITPEAQAVHGISIEDCDQFGQHPAMELADLSRFLYLADTVIAHNMAFDLPVLMCEVTRANVVLPRFAHKMACTMQLGMDICKIPSPHGHNSHKWPRLSELHEHLFGVGFNGAHSALSDAEACFRCYVKMVKDNLI